MRYTYFCILRSFYFLYNPSLVSLIIDYLIHYLPIFCLYTPITFPLYNYFYYILLLKLISPPYTRLSLFLASILLILHSTHLSVVAPFSRAFPIPTIYLILISFFLSVTCPRCSSRQTMLFL